MAIPITVDNITYKSTNALIKALNLSVKEAVLYRHFTKNKHIFTLDEIKEAERWILSHVKGKEEASINLNLADILYSRLYLTKENVPALNRFILALPTQDMTEETFINYAKDNYYKIKPYIGKITLDYILNVIKYYKLNKVYFGDNDKKEDDSKGRMIATIKGKTITQYATEYGISYNTVWCIYKDIIDCSYYTEDLFIERLEEKVAEIVQRRNKKKN